MFGNKLTYIGDRVFAIGEHNIVLQRSMSTFVNESAQVLPLEGYKPVSHNYVEASMYVISDASIMYTNTVPVQAKGYITKKNPQPFYPTPGIPKRSK